MVRTSRLVLLLAAVTLSAGCLGGAPLVGEPVPPFEFVTNEGTLVNETTYLGKFVILDLMATWCAPCKLEVAHLRTVQETFGDEVVILSVGVSRDDTIAQMEAFEEEHGGNWPWAVDRSGGILATMQGRGIPTLVVIDPEGTVVLHRFGEVLPSAMVRVIDPSAAPSPVLPILTTLAGAGLGFLGALNPYRRAHRDGAGGGPTLAALGVFFALTLLAWPFAALASTRATYGSLFIGALSLGAALWWLRARRKATPREGAPWQRASDRAYELAPAFAGSLVMALASVGSAGFFGPLFGFLAGATAAYLGRSRLRDAVQERLGVAGLVVAGAGLFAFGVRILLAEVAG